MSDDQSLNISFSADHNIMHKIRSQQTGGANRGDVGIWIHKKLN